MTAATDWIRVLMTFDRERSTRVADWLAVALAVSLPWSTSATGILVAVWLIALIPILDLAALRRALMMPAGGVPVLLWLLALAGMLWAVDVSLAERWDGLKSYHKLLVVPLLIVQFQRSGRAPCVLNGFLISCGALLALSWVLVIAPDFSGLGLKRDNIGVPVKDYITQGGEFTFCVFALAALALYEQRRAYSIALAALALAFLANVLYVIPSRTPLVAIPMLSLLFAAKHLNWRGTVALVLAGTFVGVLAWSFAPPVRDNLSRMFLEMRNYQPEGARTRAGERLEFWRKSVGFIAAAPIIGNGTGSINGLFRGSVEGKTGMAGLASTNPHNQTLAVAIQLGLVGTVILLWLWLAHLLLFTGPGITAWIGTLIVAQNVIGSLFGSHLFDFTQGWSYCVGVGVAAGAILRSKAKPATVSPPGP